MGFYGGGMQDALLTDFKSLLEKVDLTSTTGRLNSTRLADLEKKLVLLDQRLTDLEGAVDDRRF